ncbi:hypothetical protein HPB51_029180 [Rhipicephalus microplus]|uniref:Uncharacterized protein n=1 Tax=Rhipicephalus microplus TaxID=6941 RepID=A0A9J6CV88_RHIMP|nr:hypothetical protein HPB51_029180 [Rhipicephalus microplus]
MTKFFSQTGLRLTIGRRCKIAASPHQQRTRSSAPAQRGGLDSAIRCLPRSALPRITRADSDDTGPQARTARGDSVVCNAFPMHDAALVRRLKAPAFVNAGDPDAVHFGDTDTPCRRALSSSRDENRSRSCSASYDASDSSTARASWRLLVGSSWRQGFLSCSGLVLIGRTDSREIPLGQIQDATVVLGVQLQ